MPLTPSTAAAAAPRIPPPCASYADRMLSRFWETVAFAAFMTEPMTLPMPEKIADATSRAAPSFSLKKSMIALTAFRNHSHLL